MSIANVARSALRIVGSAGLLALLVYIMVGDQHPLDEGSPAPAVHARLLDGRTADMEFTGQFTVVNIWATWCPPCIVELPELARVSQRYAGRVRFVGLASESNREDVIKIRDRFGIPYDIAQIGPSVAGAWGATALPSTYIVDPQGKIAWSVRGAVDEKYLSKTLDAVLAR